MFRTVAAALAVAAVPALGFAQTAPYLATVSDPEVKLRAGPSDQFPETGSLPRGARVTVEREESNGWLAVWVLQGQVSWVHHTFLEGTDANRPTPYNVNISLATEAEVTLAAGQVGVPQPLDIRRVKVPNGTTLTVIGPPVAFDGKKWYPILPPPGDFRYLPKSAVQFQKPANTNFVVRDTAPLPPSTPATRPETPGLAVSQPGAIQPAGATRPAPKPAVSHPLWTQAEAAEQAGKYDEAEKLFFELARVMNGPGGDHDVANMCYSRIHNLREKKRGAGNGSGNGIASATGSSSPSGTGTGAMPKDNRSTLLPPSPGGVTQPTTPPAGPTPSAPPATNPDDRPRWTGAGVLTRSPLTVDGRKTYALESSLGVVRAYVVPTPGLDLEKYVNRRVDVYGVGGTRRDLSRPYVVASSIELVGP